MKKPSDLHHTLFAITAAAILTELIPAFVTGSDKSLLRIYAVQGTVTVLAFGIWPLLLKTRKWPGYGTRECDSLLLLISASLLGVIAQIALGFLTESWISWTGTAHDPGLPMPETGLEWAAAVLVLVILPALAEEAFFRGMMVKGFHEVMPLSAAAAISVFLFAAAHMSIAAFPAMLVFGIMASLLAIKGGKLKYSIAFHLAYNLTALILSVL